MKLYSENVFHNSKMVQAINKALLLVGLKSCRLLTPQGRRFPSPILGSNISEKPYPISLNGKNMRITCKKCAICIMIDVWKHGSRNINNSKVL